MSWWGWLIVGIVLVGAELATDAAFYLVLCYSLLRGDERGHDLAGVAAICVGILGLAGVGLPVWAQWVAFSALAIASMVLFRQKCYSLLRGDGGGAEFRHPAVGAVVAVEEDLAPGGRTRVRLQGTEWTAVNVGPDSIPRGVGAVVVDTDGVALEIIQAVSSEQPVR